MLWPTKKTAVPVSVSYPLRQKWVLDDGAYTDDGLSQVFFFNPPRQRWVLDVVAYKNDNENPSLTKWV